MVGTVRTQETIDPGTLVEASGGILVGADYRDRVHACWMGKNCGGTLGAPLEEMFGRAEPFDVSWYPDLPAGGIPNDDLELQLILLKAVEECGFGLSARDLAGYWLDHVGYNFDEYGLAKANLRLGLWPPLCGSFNNWFRDCMGSPIRSELWACLAPGLPALAAHYAHQDAMVDHAGGEGVWGEMFNAALQSAAFVERDPHILLDIALSYIPPDCAVARAVGVARTAYQAGAPWTAARGAVLAAVPSPIAQYAPPNVAFTIIGWLYGADFGDALCTAVNCGYDTDCTGATVGALLGILGGSAGLPARWTAPLGDGIATNADWGGLRGVSDGPNPIPVTLTELTDRVCALGERLVMLHKQGGLNAQRPLGLRGLPLSPTPHARHLHAPPALAAQWWAADASTVRHALDTVEVMVSYPDGPALVPGVPLRLRIAVRAVRTTALDAEVQLTPPPGWTITPGAPQRTRISAAHPTVLSYVLQAVVPGQVDNTNPAWLTVQPEGRPAEPAVPVAVLGARQWLLSQQADGALPAPAAGGAGKDPGERAGWTVAYAPGNALPDAIDPAWMGTLHARLYLWSAESRTVRLGVPGTCPRTLRLDRHVLLDAPGYDVLRPNYGHGGGDGASFVDAPFKRGWNEVWITYTRSALAPPFAAHLTLSTPDMFEGIGDLGWTRTPWDETGPEGAATR